MKRYLEYDGLKVLAHRGGAEESFENTLESFEYSQSIGCEFIETDVQASSDGVPYIFHDDDLRRILNKSVKFNELSSKEIDELQIFEKYKIPKLSETLIQFPNLLFQIDVKTDEVVEPALNVIHDLNVMDRVCIASFSSNRLNKIRSLNSELCISMGPNEVLQTFLASWNLYKGEISKSGVPILPSKRARKIPEKIQVSKDDLSELQNTTEQPISDPIEEAQDEETDVSLDEMKDQEESVSDETENKE